MEDPSSVVAPIHDLLGRVEEQYHAIFEGHVPDEVHRFEQFLSTVRMIVDQSADRLGKGE